MYFINAATVSDWELCYADKSGNSYSWDCSAFPADGSYSGGDFLVKDYTSNTIGQNEGEVVLRDANNDVIDAWRFCQLSGKKTSCTALVTGADELPAVSTSCVNEIIHSASNKDMARKPDGTGAPADNGSTPTKGASNNGNNGGGDDPVIAASFNCVHDGNATSGRLYTRIAGTAFDVEVIALDVNSVKEDESVEEITVELVDATSGSGVCSAMNQISSSSTTLVAGSISPDSALPVSLPAGSSNG